MTVIRLLLRGSSLAAKFMLTIAVTRMLGFSAVADYGLAIAVSVIASKLFGLGFSAEINRRLSISQPYEAIREARALCGVYAGFYILAMLAGLMVWHAVGLTTPGKSSTHIYLMVAVVAIAEHYAFEVNSYVFSLHRSWAGSLILFVRTGLWPAFAIAGLLLHQITTIDAVFALWIGFNLVSMVWGWCVIQGEQAPPHDAPVSRVDWRRMMRVWKQGSAFYVATVLLSSIQYAERFIAAPILGHDELGRYVFVWSIANAVQTLAYAACVVTAGPLLARAASENPQRFRSILRRSMTVVLGATVLVSLAIIVLHDVIFGLTHESASPAMLATLLILLVSFVLRSVSDLLWSAAIALKTGWAVAGGVAVAGIISMLFAWLVIPYAGKTGAAISHLFASAMITVGIAWIVRRHAVRLDTTNQAGCHAT